MNPAKVAEAKLRMNIPYPPERDWEKRVVEVWTAPSIKEQMGKV